MPGRKTAISPRLLSRLDEAVRALKASPRFPMVSGLKVRELLGKRKNVPHAVSDWTLAMLVGIPAEKIAQQFLLGPASVELLLKVLAGLLTTPPAESGGKQSPGIVAKQGLPLIHSSEAEAKINQLVTEIRRSPHFERYASRTVGDFWDVAWPRAPFEEALTLRQVTELNVESFTKKRSFSGQKVAAFIQALERSLRQPSPASLSDAAPGKNGEPAAVWGGEVSSLPAVYQFVAMLVEQSCAKAESSPSTLVRFLPWIPATLSAADFCILVADNGSAKEGAKSFGITLTEFHERADLARARLRQSFEGRCQEVYHHWTGVLSGPGVGEEVLLGPFRDPVLPGELLQGVARVLLRALGASAPIIDREELLGFWTLNPRAAGLLFESLLGLLPKHDTLLRQEAAVLFPLVSFDELLPLLKKRAVLSKREQVWSLR